MAKNLWLRSCAAAAVMIFAGAVPLSAQMFEDAAVPTAEENQPAAPRFNNSWANPRRSQAAQPAAKSTEMPDLSVDKTGAQAAQDARKSAAEALSKSLAGKRGTSAIRRVYAKGEKPPAEEESLIFLFYKDFKNPIEQTYHEAGSGVQYTYHNADRAVCYGIELDVKKNLSFLGMKDFNFIFNGAYIYSRIYFPKGAF